VLTANVHCVGVVYVRNGCRKVALTSARSSSPANDQMWLASHHRQNGARDQVPVVVQIERDHGLHVEQPAIPVIRRADVLVVVELQRHADQRCDRV
jgi:hypothetical protein